MFDFNKAFLIEINTLDIWECKVSKFYYPAAGHVITGSLKINSVNRIYLDIYIPRYRFPYHIDFNICHLQISEAYRNSANCSANESMLSLMLYELQVNVFKIIDLRISFCLKQGIQDFHRN